jgi:hypothetical protein
VVDDGGKGGRILISNATKDQGAVVCSQIQPGSTEELKE